MNKGKKEKFFVFSDESGSWHEEDVEDIYLRSWVVMTEENYFKLQNKIQEISSFLDCTELKWKTLAGQTGRKYMSEFKDISFRIYITVSVPCDIDWSNKYDLTKNFSQSISSFDFGKIDFNLVDVVKKKILKDIKYLLFLNYYERTHIKNAVDRIEKAIKPSEYELVYRIDPPQSTQKDWSEILNSITDKQIEFPQSHKDEGIQFADVVAGAFKSLFMKDKRYEQGKEFFLVNKDKFFKRSTENPNPNLIFYPEINQNLINNIKEMWKL